MFITENGTRPQDLTNFQVMFHICFQCILTHLGLIFAGFGDLQKPETTLTELLNDTKRIQYMSGYLDALQSAMRYRDY